MDRKPSPQDVIDGLHSNIPACCVLFFIAVWLPANDREQDRYRREMRAMEKRLGAHVEYIQCPRCLREGVYTTLHACDGKPECRQRLPPLDTANTWAFKHPTRRKKRSSDV